MALGLALARTLTGYGAPAIVGSSPCVLHEMECSCRAMLADEMHYEKKPLAGLSWTWRMSRTTGLRPEALLNTFAPRIEHIHLHGPLAYLKRLQELSRRTWQLLLSGFPGLNRWKPSSSN